MPPSSRGLGHIPFTDAAGVRIPVGAHETKLEIRNPKFKTERFKNLRAYGLQLTAYGLELVKAGGYVNSSRCGYAVGG